MNWEQPHRLVEGHASTPEETAIDVAKARYIPSQSHKVAPTKHLPGKRTPLSQTFRGSASLYGQGPVSATPTFAPQGQ